MVGNHSFVFICALELAMMDLVVHLYCLCFIGLEFAMKLLPLLCEQVIWFLLSYNRIASTNAQMHQRKNAQMHKFTNAKMHRNEE